MVFVPVAHVHSSGAAFSLNQAGFLSATLLQCAVVCLLLLALEHEYKFRSPGDLVIMLLNSLIRFMSCDML